MSGANDFVNCTVCRIGPIRHSRAAAEETGLCGTPRTRLLSLYPTAGGGAARQSDAARRDELSRGRGGSCRKEKQRTRVNRMVSGAGLHQLTDKRRRGRSCIRYVGFQAYWTNGCYFPSLERPPLVPPSPPLSPKAPYEPAITRTANTRSRFRYWNKPEDPLLF